MFIWQKTKSENPRNKFVSPRMARPTKKRSIHIRMLTEQIIQLPAGCF